MTHPVHDPHHLHNAVWREYTQSLLENKPKTVDSKSPYDNLWRRDYDPKWHLGFEYRIARPMLKLSYEVPMPVTEPLKLEQKYWVALSYEDNARCYEWENDGVDTRWLDLGLIYLTEADAQAAIDARNAAMTAALVAAK